MSDLPSRELSPPPRRGKQGVWAGAILLFGGLGLIVLGGCFLIGAIYLAKPELLHPALQTDVIPPETFALLVLCCVVAGLCFLGALVVSGLGVRVLLRVSREDQTTP